MLYLDNIIIKILVHVPLFLKRKKGIAIIRLDAIGDFVLWLDSAKEYRKIYSDSEITLVANSSWADWARTFEYWDKVYSLNIKLFQSNYLYRIYKIISLRLQNFEIAIQPTYSRSLYIGDSVVRATAASTRVGDYGDTSNMSKSEHAIGNSWYTRIIKTSNTPLMELLRNAEFIAILFRKEYKASLPTICMNDIGPFNYLLKFSYLVIFPGASWSGKRWPIEHFKFVAEKLSNQYKLKVVICGSSGDSEICNNLHNILCESINLTNKTTLLQLTEIIRNAKLLISNDTSAVHIATGVGTPSVCIVGGGHFGRFLPYPEEINGTKPAIAAEIMDCYYCNWKCTQKYKINSSVPCINKVSVNRVIKISQNLIEQRNI